MVLLMMALFIEEVIIDFNSITENRQLYAKGFLFFK